jgi:hypothetical protein
MIKYARYLYLYLKHRKDIDQLYNFSLKGKYGERVPEDLKWFERTDYWLRSE